MFPSTLLAADDGYTLATNIMATGCSVNTAFIFLISEVNTNLNSASFLCSFLIILWLFFGFHRISQLWRWKVFKISRDWCVWKWCPRDRKPCWLLEVLPSLCPSRVTRFKFLLGWSCFALKHWAAQQSWKFCKQVSPIIEMESVIYCPTVFPLRISSVFHFIRALMFVEKTYNSMIPEIFLEQDDITLLALINRELTSYKKSLECAKLRDGLRHILSISRHGNQYVQSQQPWVKAKGSAEDK